MDKEPDYDPLRGQQRVFTTQLVLCTWIGISSFLLFCFLRYKWPHIYAIRTLRKTNVLMKHIPSSWFGWVGLIINISDQEVLEYSGLDAYVFIMFFKMGIKIFFQLLIAAFFFLSPVRYYYTGHYDKDEIPWLSFLNFIVNEEFMNVDSPQLNSTSIITDPNGVHILPSNPDAPDFSDIDNFPHFLWVYPIFAYIFSFLIYINLFDYTKKVIKARQKYLASQDSIVDRTIKLDGIPRRLLLQKNTEVLKDFIEDLGIGKVNDINVIYDCHPLDNLIERRKRLVKSIENYISWNYKISTDIYNGECPLANINDLSVEKLNLDEKLKSKLKDLNKLDSEIRAIQQRYSSYFRQNLILRNDPMFSQIPSAFVTMDSVASAQMAAQTILDPRVYKLMVNLAPAPTDIKWSNLRLNYYKKMTKGYFITFVIVISYFPIFFLVSSLATLLDLKSITKFWPALGEFIKKSNWLTTFVTGILPPMLYSLLNVSLPYFYRYLSKCQGYSSNSDIELSTLAKNFFYIFFNLFLVFIISGTIWDYLSFIRDTTKIAYQLASSLKKKSLFYVDLILLQGLGMFPIRLLQIGDVVLLNLINKVFLVNKLFLKTPRDYRFYYFTPPVFDFGIQLPQHILIFIIILIYSVVSTKIVASGLVYFGLGYLVYKYQLIYNYVHPPHSTGKVWPMIVRRLILGMILFQLFMCGTLALEGAVLLSILCFPLIIMTLVICYNYEKYYLPLNNFIALRAIQSPVDFDKEFDDEILGQEDESMLNYNSLGGRTSSNDILNHFSDEMIDQSSTLQPSATENESMLVNGEQTIDYLSISTRKRRISTVDEERERFSNYTYPNLTYELDGPMIQFKGDNVGLLKLLEGDLENQNNIEELSDSSGREISNGEIIIIHKNLVVSEWE